MPLRKLNWMGTTIVPFKVGSREMYNYSTTEEIASFGCRLASLGD